MRTLLAAVVGCSLLSWAPVARAGSHSPHHCVKEGAELAGVSKKECKKQGGNWEKLATPATPPAPGTTPPGGSPPPADAKAPGASPAP